MNQEFKTNFHPLFKVAWYLSLIMLILIPIQILIFVVSPPPTTVKGLFELYRQNPFLGLLSLDFLYIINNIILIVIDLALFVLLYNERPTTISLALIFAVVSNACYYPSNPAFEMLTLSNHYFQALPGELNIYLSAGEALMAGYTGTTFDVYYVLGALSLLLFTYSLLKSPNSKKSLGVWGLISGVLMIIPSSAGLLGMIFSLLSLIPWLVFIFLLMRKFRELALSR